MKKVSSIIWLFLGMFVITQCIVPLKDDAVQDSYTELLNTLPNELINHLPLKLTDSIVDFRIIFPEGAKMFFGSYVLLEYKLDSTKFFVFEDSLTSVACNIYNSSDTCLLIINRFGNNSLSPDAKNIKPRSQNCDINKCPVPNFYPIKIHHYKSIKNEDDIRLSPDYKLYVLDAKPGIYIDKKFLSGMNGVPDSWKHGYSKGVALNKRTYNIMYWLSIW
ncbi:MAG: hypothetical protein GXO89_05770 [Chlorobi bacterium]|nr:hypothetical protein [Chlorobiota bacterium]